MDSGKKLTISKDTALGFDVTALSSAYNGIIGSPLFTAVFATEFNVGKKDALAFLAWNMVAGVIGFFYFQPARVTFLCRFPHISCNP